MSAAPDPPEPLAQPSVLDQDAFCPGCGYNVRGLAGDPIRCPECGLRYARTELRWPKHRHVMTRLERCQRDLSASADLCALATLPGLLGIVGLFGGVDDVRFISLPVVIVAAAIWLIGCAVFAIRCRGLPGWPRALAIYHVTAAPAMLVNLLLVSIAWALVGGLCSFGPAGVLALGLLFAWLAVRLDPMRWLKRQGADRLNALAEQLAERMPGDPPHDAV